MSSQNGASHNGGLTLWFTGLSGAGKSTIAEIVEAELRNRGLPETDEGQVGLAAHRRVRVLEVGDEAGHVRLGRPLETGEGQAQPGGDPEADQPS